MAFTLVTNQTIIARNAGTLYGVAIGNTNMASYVSQAGTNPDAFLNLVYTNSVGNASPAVVAANLLAGLGLPAVTVPATAGSASQIATDYIIAQLTPVAVTARGAVVNQILNLFSGLTADPVFGTFATTWNTQVTNAVTYASVSGNTDAAISTISTTVSTAGSSFTFTTGADNFTGTANNDTFTGFSSTTAGTSTYTGADVLNGGSGTDTFNLTTDSAVTPIFSASGLVSIEKLNVTSLVAAPTLTLTGVTGLTDINSTASTVATAFTGVGNLVNSTLTNISTAAANFGITYTDAATSGSADATTLTLSAVGTSTARPTVTIATTTPSTNSIETLNIVSNGASNFITLATDAAQTSLKTINISGANNLSLGLTADRTVLNNLAITSTATGAVTIGGDGGLNAAAAVVLGAANDNVVLGSGNDAVYFGANLNSSDTVDGGSGTDTLGVSAAVTNAIMTNVKNIEVIRFDTSGGNITQDAGITSVAGDNFVDYAAAGANTLTLNNLANNLTTTFLGGASTAVLTEVLKDNTGLADTQTVIISNGTSNAAATLGTLTNITGLETLNLVSTGGTATNTITTDSVTASTALTGSSDFTITNAIAATAFNASAFTGKLTIKAGATATNIQGGTGNDTITGGVGADTLVGGSGNDTINLGSTGITAFGADVVSGGAGNDTFNFSATEGASAALTSYATFATITDFTVGTSASNTDFLQFSATDTNFGASNNTPTAATGLAKGAVAAALTVGDTMVVQAVAQNASAAALTASVSFIKLTTGVAFTTDVAGTAAAAIGTASVTGLAANGVYLASYYDTTNSKMVVFDVNVGANAAADTVLASNDLANGNAGAYIHVIGVVNMTAADYANFGATNLAVASA